MPRDPVGQEAKVLLALGSGAKAQADLGKMFGMSEIGNNVKRLKRKGLVEEQGSVRRYRAPASKLIALTAQGEAAVKRLQ